MGKGHDKGFQCLTNISDISEMKKNVLVVFMFILLGIGLCNAQQPVLLNNESNLLPLGDLDRRKVAVLIPEAGSFDAFAAQLARYTAVDPIVFTIQSLSDNKLDEMLKLYNTLIFAFDVHQHLDQQLLNYVQAKNIGKDVLVLAAGPGIGLRMFDFVRYPVLWMPELNVEAQKLAGMSVFGGVACTGRLNQNFSVRYTQGAGFTTQRTRLQYTGMVGTPINSRLLTDSVDRIMDQAIRERATPGGVVMVVRDGNVIFEKAYGHHTYEQEQETSLNDIFDLASITKIAATTPVVMRLTEQGLIELDSTMGRYLWQVQGTDKENIKIREVMLHEAGFIPFIPFYTKLKTADLSPDSSAAYAVKVADGSYIRTGYYKDVMWPEMLASKLNGAGRYIYSDVSMYVMKEIAEHQTGVPIQDYVQQEFYRSLGMITAGYNPRERFVKSRIVPTEYDRTFRKTLLQGYVHDQGAAMAGGIAGHAGLFSRANDLAIFGQLLLNRGIYGGVKYFQPETVDLFTSNQSLTSRRGLGFDRKDPDPKLEYPSELASDATYGHTGYTGTCIWIDPQEKLVYIFLSNRVHPEVSGKLSSLNIRSRIQDAVYRAIQ